MIIPRFESFARLLLVIGVGSASGCALGITEVRWNERAEQAALERARFDSGCASLAATRLGAPQMFDSHRDLIVGIEGCERKEIYVARCQMANGLYSTDVTCQAILNSAKREPSR